MTPTEIRNEAQSYISTLDHNHWRCKFSPIRDSICVHETRRRRALLHAFYAGYNTRIFEEKKNKEVKRSFIIELLTNIGVGIIIGGLISIVINLIWIAVI